MTASAAGKILDFANSNEIGVQQKPESIAAKTREDTASVTRLLESSLETEETCLLKNIDETAHFQSEKRHEWIREVIVEGLQGTAEGRIGAPRLASSSRVSLPGRNECPGTDCSLIVKEKIEDSSC